MDEWGTRMVRRYFLANAIVWPLLYLFILADPFGLAEPLFGRPTIDDAVGGLIMFPAFSLLLVGLPTLLFMALVGKAIMKTDSVWAFRLVVLAGIGWVPWFVMTRFESPNPLGYGSLLSQIVFALMVPVMARTPEPKRQRQGPVA